MKTDLLLTEITFKAVRSSGPGGQHVNKTASKVEVSLDIQNSQALSDKEKERLGRKLSSKMTTDGMLILQCAETRSQHRNKAIGIERLLELLKSKLKVDKPRKKTKPSKGSVERRLKSKKDQALKKANRKPPRLD